LSWSHASSGTSQVPVVRMVSAGYSKPPNTGTSRNCGLSGPGSGPDRHPRAAFAAAIEASMCSVVPVGTLPRTWPSQGERTSVASVVSTRLALTTIRWCSLPVISSGVCQTGTI